MTVHHGEWSRNSKFESLRFDLPKITGQAMALLNRIARADPVLAISVSAVGSVSGHHNPAAASVVERAAGIDRIDLSIGGESLSLAFDGDTIAPLLRYAGIDDDAARQMEPDLAVLIMEHLLEPWLDAAEALAERSVRIVGMKGKSMSIAALGPLDEWAATSFELTGDLWEQPIGLRVSAEDVGSMTFLTVMCERLASTQPHRHVVDGSCIPITAILATVPAVVSMGDLLALRRGDALLFESDWAVGSACTVMIGGLISLDASREREGIRLSGGIRDTFDSEDSTKEIAEMSDDIDIHARLDAIPVTVSIELGRLQIPINKISDLVEGSVLPFAEKMPSRVQLVANGRPIAAGELVRIDERVGVRILSARTQSDSATTR